MPGEEEFPSVVLGDFEASREDKGVFSAAPFQSGNWVTLSDFDYDTDQPVNWLRAEIDVPVGMLKQPRPLAITIYSTVTSVIYINGKQVGSNGVPSPTSADEQPGRVHRIFPLRVDALHEGKNIISVRFSAHGFGEKWSFVKPELEVVAIIMPLAEKGHVAFEDYLPFLMMTGSIFTAAVFFLMGAFIRRKVDAEIWLAPMFALAWVELLLGILATLYSYPYSYHILWLYLWYVCRIYAGVFLFRFVANRLDITVVRPWAYTWILPALLLITPVVFNDFSIEFGLFLSTMLYTLLAIIAALYAARKKHPYGKLVLLVLLLFSTGFFFEQDIYLSNYYYYYMSALSVVLFVLQAIAFEHKRREAFEISLLSERLELELLKSHLQPHFIMNTLSALAEWIRENPDVGVKMIHALASEFRILREIAGEQSIPLFREIELCNVHLELMSYRKDVKFRLETSVQDGEALVPPAIFHTLIENAMTHTRFKKDVGPFRLEQHQFAEGGLQYELIAPSGEPLKRKVTTGGIGLSYVRARMKDVWGESYLFEDGMNHTGNWTTTIKLETKRQ